MRLRRVAAILLHPTAPFHFDGTVFNPAHFPGQGSHWDPGRLWMAMRWRERTYGVRLRNLGVVLRPKVELAVYARRRPPAAVLASIADEIRWRFDLNSTGVPEFVRRFRRDPYVGPAIRRRPGMRPADILSLYEYLVITVLLQNTMVHRSVSMLQALYERFGRRVEFDGQRLWAFWDPKAIYETPEGTLRALKVGYRAKILKRQAEQVVSGAIDEAALRTERDPQAVMNALDVIYGVGPQSASYMLTEFFHFYETMREHVSPWEGKIMGRLIFGRPVKPERIPRFFKKRYGEFDALAAHYLFVDAFWRHRDRSISWLAQEIRL